MFEKLFKKKLPLKPDLLIGDEEITAIKPTKPVQSQQFLKDFDMTKYGKVDEKILEKVKNQTKIETPNTPLLPEDKPKIFNPDKCLQKSGSNLSFEQKKQILKESIIVMASSQLDSFELDFIGNSRINGKPIYRYIGIDFISFRDNHKEIEFEEVIYQPGHGISGKYNPIKSF